jgi:uncharacterized protein YcbK (DUF882 family)
MGNLTTNLSRSEFACECKCGFDTVDFQLPYILQDVVNHFASIEDEEMYIEITGPNRCKKHNTDIGGADDSQHLYARAADFKIFFKVSGRQIDPDRVSAYLENKYAGKFGIGRYYNRTHMDTRTNGPARWDKR